jgi:predicted hotdog family 3-hydroxylacyl-ACP dehydratase
MPLAEHDLLLGTILQLPFTDPPLHCPAEAVGVLTGIFILQHFQQSRGIRAGLFLSRRSSLSQTASSGSLRVRQ